MSSRLWLAVTPLLLLVAGCVNEPIGQRDPSLGEAVKYNTAIQTISPDPIYPEGSAQPGENGDKGARAVKRYREGDVKPVETMGTTGTTSTGSTGGPQ